MNKAQLLQRQLGIKTAGRAGDNSLYKACRRFLAPPLVWKPTPTLLTHLEHEGYWPEVVEHLVPVFVIQVIEQNIALQNIDAFFIEYIRHRVPKDEAAVIDIPLVKRALGQFGLTPTLKQLIDAKTLHDNKPLVGQGTPSSHFFRFCMKYSELLFG